MKFIYRLAPSIDECKDASEYRNVGETPFSCSICKQTPRYASISKFRNCGYIPESEWKGEGHGLGGNAPLCRECPASIYERNVSIIEMLSVYASVGVYEPIDPMIGLLIDHYKHIVRSEQSVLEAKEAKKAKKHREGFKPI